jgi:Zn-dependent protease
MRSGWKIGRLAGIDIAIHPSWLVIAFLLTLSFGAGFFPREFPGWSEGEYWLVAVVASFLFFASVLVHELSHAVLARRYGMRVGGITLFIFGGATELEDEPASARDEALIAASGPAASLAIGVLLTAAAAIVTQAQIGALLAVIGMLNLLLGAFNLVPGFPLDGGRLLRAVIWRVRGDRFAATRAAALAGRLVAYTMIALGAFMVLNNVILGGLWLALIGWFLSTAAESSAVQAGIEHSLRGIKVRDVMELDPGTVSPNESVAALVAERLMRGDRRSFLVTHDDGGLAGIVTLTDVQRISRDQWERARVTDIMTRFGDLATVVPQDEVTTALALLQDRNVGQLPVLGDGRMPAGLLTRVGILRLIEARMKLGV